MFAEDLNVVAPEVLLAVFAMAALMWGAYAGREVGRPVLWASCVLLVVVGLWIGFQPEGTRTAFDDSFVSDGFARFAKVMILFGAAAALAMSHDYLEKAGLMKFEYPVLIVLSVRTFGDETNNDLSLPGTGSQDAKDLLEEKFPPQQNGVSPIVFDVPRGKLTDDEYKQPLTQAIKAMRKAPHVYSITNPISSSGQTAGLLADDKNRDIRESRLGVGERIARPEPEQCEGSGSGQMDLETRGGPIGDLDVIQGRVLGQMTVEGRARIRIGAEPDAVGGREQRGEGDEQFRGEGELHASDPTDAPCWRPGGAGQAASSLQPRRCLTIAAASTGHSLQRAMPLASATYSRPRAAVSGSRSRARSMSAASSGCTCSSLR